MSRRPTSYAIRALLAIAFALAVLPAGTASAGRLVATGHDADLHCTSNQQCHFIEQAVRYIRAGSTRKVLVLDRDDLDLVRALDNAFGAGAVPRDVMDPRSAAFAGAPLNTATYSAILVASDSTCGGCDLNEAGATPDSDAINARKADIATFFNAGGGILALAGADHGGNDSNTADDTYYSFVPLPLGGAAVSPPFSLTADGKRLGFTDGTGGTQDDINCCPTHNSFSLPPAGGALKVAETDSKGLAETLFAEGNISGGVITPPSPSSTVKPGDVIKLPPSRKCVSKRDFFIRLVRPRGVELLFARVNVNGRQTAVFIRRERFLTIRGRVLRRRRLAARVDLRGLTKGRFTVEIRAVTKTLRVLKGKRRYRTCTRKRRGGRRPRL